jgi:hypothetical protein
MFAPSLPVTLGWRGGWTDSISGKLLGRQKSAFKNQLLTKRRRVSRLQELYLKPDTIVVVGGCEHYGVNIYTQIEAQAIVFSEQT